MATGETIEIREMFIPKEAYDRFESAELAEKAPEGCYVLGTAGMEQILSVSTEPHFPGTPWQKALPVSES